GVLGASGPRRHAAGGAKWSLPGVRRRASPWRAVKDGQRTRHSPSRRWTSCRGRRRRFSALVAIQEGHELVTGGLYRVIRHPSYLGLLLGLFGWVLIFRSAIAVLVSLLLLPPLVARLNAEEALL